MALTLTEQPTTKEVLIFVAGSWFLVVAAAISHIWTGFGAAANITPIALWIGLFAFSVRRIGNRSFWLMLALPFVIASPIVFFGMILATCYLGLSPNGCF